MTGPRIAAFVSPHGFGHAARSSAVLAEAHQRAGATFELFTTAPEWFFEESISGLFRRHPVVVDVGFRQLSALRFDLEGTVRALEEMLPYDAGLVRRLAAEVRKAECRAVLCDIAPLGVAVAEEAGLPSLLVENFSWPWLYEPLLDRVPRLRELSAELERWSTRATVHVQARPVCQRDRAVELVDPISRAPRRDRAAARAALCVAGDGPLVVVTMGGYGEDLPFLGRLRSVPGVSFLVTGVGQSGVEGNLHLFDNDTPLYMPDVLRAADAVVAKLGYGTVAEVWHEGIPFAWVTRDDFREMASLERFAEAELRGFGLPSTVFAEGAWVDRLPELLDMERHAHTGGGAARAAEILLGLTG